MVANLPLTNACHPAIFNPDTSRIDTYRPMFTHRRYNYGTLDRIKLAVTVSQYRM